MKRAFTLIELLIVVIIVGILATVALPQYQKVVERARAAEAYSMLGAIRRASIIYYHAHDNTYPLRADYLDIVVPEKTDNSADFAYGVWNSIGYPGALAMVALRKKADGSLPPDGEKNWYVFFLRGTYDDSSPQGPLPTDIIWQEGKSWPEGQFYPETID